MTSYQTLSTFITLVYTQVKVNPSKNKHYKHKITFIAFTKKTFLSLRTNTLDKEESNTTSKCIHYQR